MGNEKQITEEQKLKNDAFMGKKLYSIRAKFYDKYNVRRDIDYDIKDLIFSKLDEVEEEIKTRIKYQDIVYKICLLFDTRQSKTTIDKVVDKVRELQSLKSKLTLNKLRHILATEALRTTGITTFMDYAQALIKEFGVKV